MFYNVHELEPPPLSFPLFIFLSTSHARPHFAVPLLSLIFATFFLPILGECNASFLGHSSSFHICSHVHSRLIGYFLSSVFFLLLYLPSFYYSSTFPCPAFFLSLCILSSLPLSSSLSPSLSSAYVFALAQLSAAWSSCTHTHTQAAHICTSTCIPMTVWRSHSAISKHKGRWEAGKDRRKVKWTET